MANVSVISRKDLDTIRNKVGWISRPVLLGTIAPQDYCWNPIYLHCFQVLQRPESHTTQSRKELQVKSHERAARWPNTLQVGGAFVYVELQSRSVEQG